MKYQYALNGSFVTLAIITGFLSINQAHALSLNGALRPTLQDTVLTSSGETIQQPAKVIQIAKRRSSRSLVSKLTSGLKKKHYRDIFFTKKTGAILEAEACKNNQQYFLQIARDGDILQATSFDRCVSPKIKRSGNNAPDPDKATPLEIVATVQTKKRPRVIKQQALLKQISNSSQVTRTRTQILARQGYRHIYAPQNRTLGVMACKGGKEYSFNVLNDDGITWSYMRSQRKALGKCFGYGKQILSKRDLLTIMRRHGDTEIRIVRGQLPLFEAYSCLNGTRQHVKINRWGNNITRELGKCS